MKLPHLPLPSQFLWTKPISDSAFQRSERARKRSLDKASKHNPIEPQPPKNNEQEEMLSAEICSEGAGFSSVEISVSEVTRMSKQRYWTSI